MTNLRFRARLAQVLLLLVSLVLLAGCGKEAADATGRPPGGAAPPPVRVAQAEVRDIPLQVETFGTVEPLSAVEIRAQVSGQVQKVWFQEGQMVEAGEELFTIDPRPYEVGLAQAEANLARAEAEAAEARSNAEENRAQARNAQTELERNRTLLERGMVTQEEFDTSRAKAEALAAAVKADEAAVVSSEQGIRAARAAIDASQLSLEYALIRSPLTGRTGSLLVHVGDLVRQNDPQPMVVITQMQPVYVSFTLPENHLASVRQQQARGQLQVGAVLPDSSTTPVTGTLTFIDSSVDPATSTIRLKATFSNEDQQLWPGQYTKVTLTLGTLENAVVVPAQAVQTGQEGAYVYVVGAEGTAEMRRVRTGTSFEGSLVVEEGLEAGEAVITEGHLRVAPDMPVRMLDEAAGAREDTST